MDIQNTQNQVSAHYFIGGRPFSIVDTIPLPTSEPNTSLQVWFERRWNTESVGFELAELQVLESGGVLEPGFLEGGSLCGELTILELDEPDIAPLRQQPDNISDYAIPRPYYEALGKRFVKSIQDPVSNFLALIRVQFGQHWVPTLEPWDSRNGSIGYWCRNYLGATWSLEPVMHFHQTVDRTRVLPGPHPSGRRRDPLYDADLHKVHNRL